MYEEKDRGLANAVRRLPEAKRQRCIVHLERNVLTKVPHRLRARVAKQLRSIFDGPSAAEAKKRLGEFAAGLGRQVPEALRRLEQGFAAATQFDAFPAASRGSIRSVEALPDRHSALRLVTLVALETTQVWGDRPHIDLSLLKNSTPEEALA